MKHWLTLAFIVMCLSGCASTKKEAQIDTKKVEFIKGCIVSTTITMSQLGFQVNPDHLYQGCSQMEHEFRGYERQEQQKEERYDPMMDYDRPEPRGTKYLPIEVEDSEYTII